MKHYFIVNPAAGKEDCFEKINSLICKRKELHDCEIYSTRCPGDATEYVKDICKNENGELRFYACGGDGTLNEVISGTVGFPNASVTAYPCGSGNDYVKYYGGADAFLNLDALMKADSVPVDLMKIGDRYCVNVANFGFDTTVAKTMIKVKRKPIIGGKRAYITGIVTGLFKAMKTGCTVYADGEKLNNDSILLCTVANGSYVGGSFKCAPKSKNDDGLLEVCMMNKVSRLTFFSIVGEYTEGKHLESPKFRKFMVYRRAKKVTIDAPRGFSISVDGEIVDGTHFDIEIMHKAANFAVPGIVSEKSKNAVPSVGTAKQKQAVTLPA